MGILILGMKEESQPCPHCGKIFSTKSSLEPHIMMVHKGVRKKCPDCGKVLSDLWKHMRTIHGHYRRRVKIPKEEAILQMTSTTTPIEDSSVNAMKANTITPINPQSSPPILTTPPPLEKLSSNAKEGNKKTTHRVLGDTKKMKKSLIDDTDTVLKQNQSSTSSSTTKNKRKNSLPLKVKMPF